MSGAEQRQVRAMALLELEEAKDALALLRAKSQQWYRLHDEVNCLLAQCGRETSHAEQVVRETRKRVLQSVEATKSVMDVDAVLELDRQIEAAMERVKKAEAERKALGFQ